MDTESHPILTAVDVRVLGSLLEKAATTPEVYPLTLNSLMLACNQKSNRWRKRVAELNEELTSLKAEFEAFKQQFI